MKKTQYAIEQEAGQRQGRFDLVVLVVMKQLTAATSCVSADSHSRNPRHECAAGFFSQLSRKITTQSYPEVTILSFISSFFFCYFGAVFLIRHQIKSIRKRRTEICSSVC